MGTVHPLQFIPVVAGIAATGGVRPSADGAHAKRSGSRYVLGDLLGRGGMAEVFAGHSVGDHGFQKPVAIKRLLPELANDVVFVDRLIEEAKLLVGMQHGNIVSVLDLAREGDDVFLVMEFVDGPSLRQLIKARGSRGLPLGVATYIVQSSAAGLEFAHARPGGAIIHADISPSNLLLTTSGEVRVADFGIARREGLGQGVVEGKWAYMAPEQARGESLTPRSDVFALGVVLYELLTGQHPFGRAVTAMQEAGGEVLITADHGNAETMLDPITKQAHTAHTLNLVPLVYIGRKARIADRGALQDVAPTLLAMMGLPQPKQMTGKPLIHFS